MRGTHTAIAALALLLASNKGVPGQAQPAFDETLSPPQGEAPPAEPASDTEGRTPPRLSFTYGEVSFWQPGAEEWSPAQINIPLEPGDALYAGSGASLELQIAPRAFVRAGAGTQLALENQEPDFLQFKVTAGHVSLDVRSLKTGQTIEIDAPNAAFTIESSGYYRIDVSEDTTTFITRRGGHATVTSAGGQVLTVAPSEEVVIEGAENPAVATYVAPEPDAWDRWNYTRTDHLIDAVSARYVPAGVYGVDALDHYGAWRVTADYGPVWVPQVAPGWAPYTVGRWIWDRYYGWTWVDKAPWGWAPCHHGRWVYMNGFWAWAPGPITVAPVYAPALVAFFGGHDFGVRIGVGAPAVGWVALGWGEPLVPWWGRPGFVGVPCWRGWGGPRVVNNVVIEHTTVVNVNNINVYKNAGVRNAVVAERDDHFGRGLGERVRVREIDPHHLEPLHGRLPMRPVAASLTPRLERAPRPPAAILRRSVVATRPPAAPVQPEGLNATNKESPAPRIVPGPHGPRAASAAPRAPFGTQGTVERPRPPLPPQFSGAQPRRTGPNRAPRQKVQSQPIRPNAPVGGAPSIQAPLPPHAPAQAAAPPAPHHQDVPPARIEAPRHAPPPVAARPAPQRHFEPAVPPRRSARSLPGEPANRLYGAGRQPQARRPNAPAAPSAAAGASQAGQQHGPAHNR